MITRIQCTQCGGSGNIDLERYEELNKIAPHKDHIYCTHCKALYKVVPDGIEFTGNYASPHPKDVKLYLD